MPPRSSICARFCGQVVGDAVGELHLVDRAVRTALAAGAVVRDDDDQRVLEQLVLLEVVEQAPDLVVGVAQEARVDLGHPREQLLLLLVQGIPGPRRVDLGERLAVRAVAGLGRSDRVDRRQLGVGRHDAELLLPGERLLAYRLVAHVEATLELLDPLLRRVMRGVAGAGRVVQEERLLRRDGLGVA